MEQKAVYTKIKSKNVKYGAIVGCVLGQEVELTYFSTYDIQFFKMMEGISLTDTTVWYSILLRHHS